MACIPCQQNRAQYVDAWRARNPQQMGAALTRSAHIMYDKARGIDVNQKYRPIQPHMFRSPYRSPHWPR